GPCSPECGWQSRYASAGGDGRGPRRAGRAGPGRGGCRARPKGEESGRHHPHREMTGGAIDRGSPPASPVCGHGRSASDEPLRLRQTVTRHRPVTYLSPICQLLE
ncbi:MAG: hypothetical protein ACK56I_11810, partial [bacterium]